MEEVVTDPTINRASENIEILEVVTTGRRTDLTRKDQDDSSDRRKVSQEPWIS